MDIRSRSAARRALESAAQALLRPPDLGRDQALARMERISAVTHLVISSEHLCRPQARGYGGMNNWEITRESLRRSGPRTMALLDLVARPAVTTGLHAGKVAGSLLLLSPLGGPRLRGAADAALATSTLLTYPRHHYGTDGSDQVSFLVQAMAALARAAGTRTTLVDACLWAVSAQSTMSYAASGWVKLAGPTWRQGLALEGVTRTLTYGDPHVWRAVRRFPRTARALGTGVLALECTFPLVYAAGGRLAKPYVLSASAFHLANGRIMGLGRFIPAFLSMHPTLLYTARPQRSTGLDGTPPRDDTLVGVLALAAAGLAVAGAVSTRVNLRTVRRGRGDEQHLTTRAGNRLAYRRRGRARPGDPVYVFENGLASTTGHWDWIADALADEATVVTYDRAGYGASTCRPGAGRELADLERDACDLVEHVAEGRRVVLVGHSLGGYLALRVAGTTGADVAGVAIVDSSHPDELRLSEKQKQGQKRFTEVFPVMARSLELGLGMLLREPDFALRLPAAGRALVLAQYRTGRLWRAAHREWTAAVVDFDRAQGLPPLAVPVLSLSAQHTVDDDEVQGDLHRAIVAAAPWGEVGVVEGADHDTVLSDAGAARQVADRIRAFAARCTGRTAVPAVPAVLESVPAQVPA